MTDNTHPVYHAWYDMKARCYNPLHKSYPLYGKRGIRVCDEWKNDRETFFRWALANGYNKGLWFDRKNNDEGYSPTNCHWITPKASANNTRTNQRITAFGETKTRMEWTEDKRCKVDYGTLRDRLKRGWPTERALQIPSTQTPHNKPKEQSYA